jgi:hypothetical protein
MKSLVFLVAASLAAATALTVSLLIAGTLHDLRQTGDGAVWRLTNDSAVCTPHVDANGEPKPAPTICGR